MMFPALGSCSWPGQEGWLLLRPWLQRSLEPVSSRSYSGMLETRATQPLPYLQFLSKASERRLGESQAWPHGGHWLQTRQLWLSPVSQHSMGRCWLAQTHPASQRELYLIKVDLDKLGPYVIPEGTLHHPPGLPHRPQALRNSDFCSYPELQTVDTETERELLVSSLGLCARLHPQSGNRGPLCRCSASPKNTASEGSQQTVLQTLDAVLTQSPSVIPGLAIVPRSGWGWYYCG